MSKRFPKNCFHMLANFKDPPYRYVCLLCCRQLKVASGHYPKENGVMKQSEIRKWLDEQVEEFGGSLTRVDVFVICVRLQDEIERRRLGLGEDNNLTTTGHERLKGT